MRKRGTRKRNFDEKKVKLRNIIISAVVIVFMAGIVVGSYYIISREKRNNIIKVGEMKALESADQFKDYLATSIDAIKITAYTIEKMLDQNKTQQEILDYMIGQSSAVRNAVFENTTGLYGYINGEFLDGELWEPGPDFVPTERPWYIKSMENQGRIAMIEPYLDAQTGSIKMAIGKMLMDKKNVVAMDIDLSRIQEITETAVETGESAIEFILDGDNMVVAHSDPQEVGKDYNKEASELYASILTEISTDENNYSEITYRGADYIVYTASIQDDWRCIFIQDATSVFRSLRIILFVTIGIILVMVFILLSIFHVSNRRSLIAERALAASEAKSSFLSNMSHEIRTPINSVLGMNEMILRECKDEDVISYSESIRMAGNTLLGIVNDILDFSKIEAGKMEIIPVDYDLSSLLNDLVNMIQQRADDKGLVLTLDFDSRIPKNLNGDEVRIKQVITNILTNAVKYTEKGSVTFKVFYQRSVEEPEYIFLNFSVKDTGIGIKQEDIEKLFSEFERIEEERNRSIEGTGLGMNITKRLVEMMGSKLKVESVYGQGSKFYFSLKQRVVRWEELGDYEASFREHLSKRNVYHERFIAPDADVLVVDDNLMNLKVFGNLLKKTRVRIDMVESGDECLKKTNEKKYDIIFLDHMMPEKDGIETLHELHSQSKNPNKKTPTICLTANAISGAREQYISEGFDDYLTKPIDADELEGMMMQYLPGDKVLTPEESIAEENEAAPEVSDSTGLPDFLSEIEEIDTQAGLANNGDDVENYIDTLRVYAGMVDRSAEEIRGFYQSGDIKNATIKIHALKSTSRIIGASDIGELAQRLEDAGNAEDTAVLDAELEGMLTRCQEVGASLSPLLDGQEEIDDSGLPLIGAEELAGYWDRIRELAEYCDDAGIEDVLEELKGYRFPEEEKERLQSVRQALDEFDFEKVGSVLE
ncbi:MAG: response regulator [Eubacterium sp.]|nr:response regulator [Eubacterium sp.]